MRTVPDSDLVIWKLCSLSTYPDSCPLLCYCPTLGWLTIVVPHQKGSMDTQWNVTESVGHCFWKERAGGDQS